MISQEQIKQSLDFLKAKDLENDAKNVAIGFREWCWEEGWHSFYSDDNDEIYFRHHIEDKNKTTEQLFQQYLNTLKQ